MANCIACVISWSQTVDIYSFCGWGALSRGCTGPLRGESLRFTRNSWYLLDQSWKDERLRWPWGHPVVLNFCINLVITKYKLKCQTNSIMALNCELFQSEFSVKNMFPLHICWSNDYITEIGVLPRIQFYNIFMDVLSIIFKIFH